MAEQRREQHDYGVLAGNRAELHRELLPVRLRRHVHRYRSEQLHVVGVNTSPQRRRPRPWWRSRRLITAVICVDLLGAGALAYALTRPADRPAAVATNALAGARSPPASASTPSAAASTSAPTHRRSGQSHLPQATSLPKPSGSRTAVLPAGANTDTGAGASSALKANAQASFARLQSRLGSQARIAIAVQPLGLGSMQVLGGDPAMQAMSTSKILILSALLSDKGGIHNFTPEQMSSARAAITQSDNSAILVLFSDLQADKRGLLGASAYATTLLRKAGDHQTQVTTAPPPPGYATTFGQTPWTPSSEVKFYRALALGCVLPRSDANFELELMRSIIPSESFGLGSAGFAQVAFKGGWGPEPNGQYGVRQTGIIGAGTTGIVVSLIANPVSTFAAGQSALDQVARWLRVELRLTPRQPGSCSA